MAGSPLVAKSGGKKAQRRGGAHGAATRKVPVLHILLPEIFSLVKLLVLVATVYFVLDGPILRLAEVVVGTETTLNIATISGVSLVGNVALTIGLTLTWREKTALGRKLQMSIQA